MPTWIWIVIAIIAVLVVLLAIGLVLGRRRKISLAQTPPSAPAGVEGPPPKGGYKAGGSISFSAGGGSGTATAPPPDTAAPSTPRPSTPTQPAPTRRPSTTGRPPTQPFPAVPAQPAEAVPAQPAVPVKPAVPADRATAAAPEHPVAERTEVDGQPGVGDDAAVPRDSVTRSVVDVALPEATAATAPPQAQPAAPAPDTVRKPQPAAPTAAAPAAVAPPATGPTAPASTTAAPPTHRRPTGPMPVVPDGTGTAAPPVRPTGPMPVVPDGTGTASPLVRPTGPMPVVPDGTGTAAPPSEVREEIAPTAGRLTRLRGRLSRSQNVFGQSLLGLLGASSLDEDSWTDIEDTLLMADLGAASAMEITERLQAEVAAHGVADPAAARAMLRRVLIDAVGTRADRSVRALPHGGRPSVVLIVGVNGTGKTTTTGKLARVLVADGRKVVLGAADTFRAAAADQLATWAERAGAVVVRGDSGSDPAAVAFDAVKRGIADGADAVLIDTAGRLHTKTGLMDELGKVKRVIEKQAKVDEVLLVLDATTGQNGLVQATVFAEVVDITGIVLTKLDGTAKGGIVVAVQRALDVPVKLVGLGEGADDLAPFEPEAFVDALLG